jgi:Na+-transporting methylmalonyl-CoA/oxaloacetate decarboxylase gamma subunit
MGFQNIIDADGIGLSITGMAIVFVVLILVSLYIAWLPRILPLVNAILPVVEHHHGAPMPSSGARPQASSADAEAEVVAAIALAMHHRQK